jgi:hypothetical protein
MLAKIMPWGSGLWGSRPYRPAEQVPRLYIAPIAPFLAILFEHRAPCNREATVGNLVPIIPTLSLKFIGLEE